MTFTKSRHRVVFPGRSAVPSVSHAKPRRVAMIPDLFTSPPLLRDELVSTTSQAQDETVDLCLPYLSGRKLDDCNHHGVPPLHREKHIAFLHKQMGKLPTHFVAADASRPWFLCWCLTGLRILGEDVSSYRTSLIDTARSMHNDTGGFGGGNGQSSHLATTYAMILALVLVGGDTVYEVVDRRAMWKWLGKLKQPRGGFQMAIGGEVDIRGTYCAAVVITLLNLPTELTPESPAWTPDGSNLFTNLPEYIQRCQTFEGGISAQPNGEAHGAYAFCALGCLAIMDSPDRIVPRYLDVRRLISWLSSLQYAPEGGFPGRTNKLVDGCYSHWVGGCWPIIEATLAGGGVGDSASLYSREGLMRYMMCCCQEEGRRGGLRDKPGRLSDGYHTCYVLAGLSSVQHKSELVKPRRSGLETEEQPYLTTSWSTRPYPQEGEAQILGEGDRVEPLHPLFTVPVGCVADAKRYFEAKPGF